VVVGLALGAATFFSLPGTVRLFSGTHDAYSLPDRITVCDRDYDKDARRELGNSPILASELGV
jgi:hypothetical protein